MKTIAIVCDHYLPGLKAGGPIVSIQGIIGILSGHTKIVVLTKDRDFDDNHPYDDIMIDALNSAYGCEIFYVGSFVGFLKSLRLLRCDLLYVNSFFSPFCFTYLLGSFLLGAGSRRIVAPRGELGAGALRLKSAKKRMYISLYRYLGLSQRSIFHATSDAEHDDILSRLGAESTVIPNLPSVIGLGRKRLVKTPGSARFIFLSRVTRKKNLHLALQALSKVPVGCHVIYDIWGPIEDESYWKECTKVTASLPVGVCVSYRGMVRRELISSTFSSYHALLIPTANENYGHAIVEAMLCGVVPIISDQTPWRNLLSSEAGWDVDISTSSDLSEAINKVVSMTQSEFDLMSEKTSQLIGRLLNTSDVEEKYREFFQAQ